MRATALRSLTHEQISTAVSKRLLAMDGYLDALIEFARAVWQDEIPIKHEIERLSDQVKGHKRQCERMGKVIADKDDPPATLVQMLSERETEIIKLQAEIDRLTFELGRQRPVPSREELKRAIDEASLQILSFDREAGMLLQRLLDGPIRFVPYQQFGCNKVVLRAEFRLRLVKVLPQQLYERLLGRPGNVPAEFLEPIAITVDLFEMSGAVRHAVRACELADEGCTHEDVAKKLGCTPRVAREARAYGQAMRKAGLSQPFVRLTRQPDKASRWKKTHGMDESDDAA